MAEAQENWALKKSITEEKEVNGADFLSLIVVTLIAIVVRSKTHRWPAVEHVLHENRIERHLECATRFNANFLWFFCG